MMIFDSHRDGVDMYTSNIRRAVQLNTKDVTFNGDGYDVFSVAPHTGKKLNSLEPTLALGYRLCKVLA